VRFISLDGKFVRLNIIEFKVGEFANADAGLEKEFNDGMDTDVIAADIS